MPEVPGNPSRYLVTATMDDVPHLSKDAQDAILRSTPLNQREARRTGVPSLGIGAIYPIEESFITVDDFPVPAHYARCFGMDTGWKATAGVWLAWNRENDVVYLYDAYKRGGDVNAHEDGAPEQEMVEPSSHADAFKARGAWIPGAADAAAIRSTDGKQYLQVYRGLGLNIDLPDKRSIEANILAVYTRLTTGRLKVFRSLKIWFDEFRMYRRDEDGQVVRKNDHLMAATQYGIKSALARAVCQVVTDPAYYQRNYSPSGTGWMT